MPISLVILRQAQHDKRNRLRNIQAPFDKSIDIQNLNEKTFIDVSLSLSNVSLSLSKAG
jgi:hypothetical protein